MEQYFFCLLIFYLSKYIKLFWIFNFVTYFNMLMLVCPNYSSSAEFSCLFYVNFSCINCIISLYVKKSYWCFTKFIMFIRKKADSNGRDFIQKWAVFSFNLSFYFMPISSILKFSFHSFYFYYKWNILINYILLFFL